MGKAKIPAWRCGRCQHTWKGRINRKPVRCPRCSSTTWDVAKAKA